MNAAKRLTPVGERVAMRFLIALLVGLALTTAVGVAADPLRIGVDGVLSGPNAERGQQEQNAVELALASIIAAGGVLGRPVEAVYGDNGANSAKGIEALNRLLTDQHVTVVLGAGATPVTHALMPVIQTAQVPLVVDISAGQDFVDASGIGGNPFVFKTIPSDLDIARTNIAWLRTQGARNVAIVADDLPFNTVGAASYARAAGDAHIAVADNETIPKGTADLTALVGKLKALGVDHVILLVAPSTAAFFHAYEASGWNVPISGRVDLATAIKSVTPGFVTGGGLAGIASIAVFTPLDPQPAVQQFVSAYFNKYGLVPTQRSFFAYESTYLIVDAARRAGSNAPAAIEAALKTSTMRSRLGGSYAMDTHNHPHTPMRLLGVRAGKIAVIGTADQP
jgi:branched-chain amino acid transport system substrate-binding protein